MEQQEEIYNEKAFSIIGFLAADESIFSRLRRKTKNDHTKVQSDSKKQLTVYTTVYPLQFFTEEIGKDAVKVETIYPPGTDEHTFDPSQKDIIKLANSDLFIYVGLGLEGFVEKAKTTLENEKVTMLAAGEHIHIEKAAARKQTMKRKVMMTDTTMAI